MPKGPAKGRKTSKSSIQVTFKMDLEQFDEVRKRALLQKTSFAEQLRILVEWGLEAK